MNQPLSFFETMATLTNGNMASSKQIEHVVIDSRKQVKNGLFIPIKGERFDGHDFLLQAIDNGAIACFWQQGHPFPEGVPDDFPVFIVADTLSALQKIAQQYLSFVQPIVIAITGSNGKTTTKDLTASLVKQQFRTYETKGNYNNHIGMPLSILDMAEDCEVLILEMGMSGYGEISFLSRLAEPDYAMITNIGESHLEQLGSREGIAKAKLEILDGLKSNGTLLVDGDEPLLAHIKEKDVISCGYESHCDVQIRHTSGTEEGQFFAIKGQNETYFLPLLGKHNIKNACFAIVLAKKLGISDGTIQESLQKTHLTGMRLERLKGKNNSLIINDAYNASPTSMKMAIDSLSLLANYPVKVAVLGDMYELGENEEALHRSVAEHISTELSHVITIGEKGKWIGLALYESGFQGSVSICETKQDAITVIEPLLSRETAILFKASRGMQFETLIDQLICR